MKTYTEEEQQQLGELINGVAHFECMAMKFDESCALYMSNTMAAMASTAAGK